MQQPPSPRPSTSSILSAHGGPKALEIIHGWFSGDFMSDPDLPDGTEALFTAIGGWASPLPAGPFFRACHVHSATPHIVGSKDILSWSLCEAGARYFYDTFIHGTNRLDFPSPSARWLLIKSAGPKALCTHRDLMAFAKAVAAESPDKDIVRYARQRLLRPYDCPMMDDNAEVICRAAQPLEYETLEALPLRSTRRDRDNHALESLFRRLGLAPRPEEIEI
jgi:hypothetical protein